MGTELILCCTSLKWTSIIALFQIVTINLIFLLLLFQYLFPQYYIESYNFLYPIFPSRDKSPIHTQFTVGLFAFP